MPAWWNRKWSKSKEEDEEDEPRAGFHLNFMKSPVSVTSSKSKSKTTTPTPMKKKKKPKSFDEKVEGVPLPRPAHSHADPLGSVSVSGGSSVSSSTSFDDHPISSPNTNPNPNRGHDEVRVNVRSKSPGPGSRGPTSPTSPLHQRLNNLSLDSPTGSQCHPLPLPPGSPTSPSSVLSNARANGHLENATSNVSKWRKGKLLGRGTFGHVYLGFNSENGQMCAIKEVKVVSDDQTSKECLKQLNQEINLLNQLSHPNIVQYHGSELVEESLSVYLEYVSGGSIHKLLQEYGSFKEPVIQNYTRQIVSGLAYLHGRNTVHRDIKGANILVDPNGEIKLADFGMAKHINSSASMLSFKGSPYWMAPEVVMNTNGYSLPVDIWSLGCTIIEMATSKPPWNQYEGVAAIFKIGNSKDMPEIPEHLSNDAKNFIKLCLQRDPLARPTAHKLLDHPFIRDQSATKAANVSITRDAFPCIDNTRMITSLPVSPSSSPLRRYGPTHQSCFFSPPHPAYTIMGQSSYTLNDISSYPMTSNATFALDPWHETSRYRANTPPGGSPRMRLI
ncbi:Mitogen-activated protein kinase kinase kinase 3 [Glycine max]|nr:Mitogen-activated protein kinase kinase kinase 3 [Glycine max]